MALFDVSDDVLLNGIAFSPVRIEDKQMFDDYMFNMDYRDVIWDYNFASLYLHEYERRGSCIVWKNIDGFIFLFECNKRTKKIWMFGSPLYDDSSGDFKIAFYKALRIMDYVNGTVNRSVCLYMTKKVDTFFNIKGLKSVNGNRFRAAEDFVFRCSDLIELKGKHYKSRRGMVNRLKREHPNIVIRLANDDDIDGIMQVRDKWINEHIVPLSKSKKAEDEVFDYNSFEMIIKHRKHFDYMLIVAEDDGVIVGFLIESKFSKNCLTVYKENTDTSYSGLAEYLWYESLKMFPDRPEFENDGDGGFRKDDGLYLYKMSHRPVDMIYKFTYRLNKIGNTISFKDILSDEYIGYLKDYKVWNKKGLINGFIN